MIDVYQKVTDILLAEMAKGAIPWHKPWNINRRPARNFTTGKLYRGFNFINLNFIRDFASEYWMTMNQANRHGGTVKKGEAGTLVIFWKLLEVKDQVDDDDSESRQIPMLKHYYVWNLEQIDGIDAPEENERTNSFSPIEAAEAIIGNYRDKPEILYRGTSACYSPSQDRIFIPNPDFFDSPEEFYSTLLHEAVHSTGHESRLHRHDVGNAAFDSETYSFEELIAEFGAAFLCAESGMLQSVMRNSAAYLQGWMNKLKEDKKLAVKAASAAQHAADYILNRIAYEHAGELNSCTKSI